MMACGKIVAHEWATPLPIEVLKGRVNAAKGQSFALLILDIFLRNIFKKLKCRYFPCKRSSDSLGRGS
jgi:hypothetical protein